jgi:hypothetical protein
VRLEERIWHPIYTAARRTYREMPMLRGLVPEGLARSVRNYLAERSLAAWPDRRYLEEQILPHVVASGFSRVLFVGCRRYTRRYGRWFDGSSTDFWTVDCDPRAARFGEPERHLVCDIRAIGSRVRRESFDLVILNGIFGFGVDDEASMEETLTAIHSILIPAGKLIVGWNEGLTPDPWELDAMRRLFRRQAIAPLPERKAFPDQYGHVYDFFAAA